MRYEIFEYVFFLNILLSKLELPELLTYHVLRVQLNVEKIQNIRLVKRLCAAFCH